MIYLNAVTTPFKTREEPTKSNLTAARKINGGKFTFRERICLLACLHIIRLYVLYGLGENVERYDAVPTSASYEQELRVRVFLFLFSVPANVLSNRSRVTASTSIGDLGLSHIRI